MIDLHCHLLPNIDDGSKSWEESLEMASIAYEDGITGAACTPHWIQGTDWAPDAWVVREKIREFNKRLKDESIDFTVYPGMEIGITADLPDLVSSGSVLSLNERDYLLLEIPFTSLPLGLEDIINSLEIMGKKVIFAHPERSREFQEKTFLIQYYKKLGVLVQITASSLCGDFGESAKKCSLDLANMGVIDIVASDAHSSRRRLPIVSEGLKILGDEIGPDEVDRIICNSYKVAGLESPE